MHSACIGNVSCRLVGVGRGDGGGTMEGPTSSPGSVVAGLAWPLAQGSSIFLPFSWDFTRGRPAPR